MKRHEPGEESVGKPIIGFISHTEINSPRIVFVISDPQKTGEVLPRPGITSIVRRDSLESLK